MDSFLPVRVRATVGENPKSRDLLVYVSQLYCTILVIAMTTPNDSNEATRALLELTILPSRLRFSPLRDNTYDSSRRVPFLPTTSASSSIMMSVFGTGFIMTEAGYASPTAGVTSTLDSSSRTIVIWNSLKERNIEKAHRLAGQTNT